MIPKKSLVQCILFTLVFVLLVGSVSAQVRRKKNISYIDPSASYFNKKRHALDIYFPKDTSNKKGVFVFFHGGSWKGGKKNTYRYMARNMAKKGFVAALVNYRLSPEVQYEAMADDCARSLHWIDENVKKYGGDSEKITASGHSAGGHLAAYVSIGPTFEKLKLGNPISKTILIDAFGLDMYTYFQDYNNSYSRSLQKVFTDKSEIWKIASPHYFVSPEIDKPFLILTGSKTFDAILKSSEKFHAKIKTSGGSSQYQVIKGKKHIGMITQLIFSRNNVYDLITSFMNTDSERLSK